MRQNILFLLGVVVLIAGCNLPRANSTPNSAAISTEVIRLLTETPIAYATVLPKGMISSTSGAVEALPTATPNLTPTTTPIASDPQSPLGTPTWSDPMDTSEHFFTFEDPHTKMQFSNGALNMTAIQPDGWVGWTLSFGKMVNFYLEVTAKTGSCSGKDQYGILARAPDPTQGYFYGFSCDGQFAFQKWDGQEFTTLQDWTANQAIQSGAEKVNRMGLLVQGNRFSMYANGTLVGDLSDQSYGEGTIGLFIASEATPNFTVQVDQVNFWELR